MRRGLFAAFVLALLVLGGCGSAPRRAAAPSPASAAGSSSAPASPGVVQRRGGGYYMDDGPGDNPPPNLELTPDAVPRDEAPLKSAANRPYVVFGKTYSPTSASGTFRQRGIASWYGRKFHGQRTSSGESYDMYGMTAAHPTLPIPSYVRVTNLSNNRSVVVRVNDRGPFHSDRIIDLSYTAALKLGYVNVGSTMVEIEQVHGDGSYVPPPPPVLLASAPQAVPATPGAAVPPPQAATPLPPDLAVTPAAAPATPVAATAPVAVTAPVAQTSMVTATLASPPVQVLQTSTQPDGVYLQLGAFGGRDGAEEFRAKVYQELSWLTDTIYIVARERLFRVQVGPYKDRTAATVAAEKIRQTMQLTPMLILK